MIDKVLLLPLKKKTPKTPKVKKERRQVRRRGEPLPPLPTPTPLTFTLAWGVHFYTALGLVCAAGIAAVLFQGGPDAFRVSFALMALATFIDSTDGTLARKIRIKEVLPNFDGRKLDDITDFLTYTALPLVLVWRAGLLPPGTEWSLLVPLLASAYGFCQGSAKTDDGFFLGFPSLWNVVAFYLYVLQLPAWLAFGVVHVLALLTFVPSRYLYPTQPGRLNAFTNVLGAAWALMLGYVLWTLPAPDALRSGTARGLAMGLAKWSLFFPAFYMAASWVVTARVWSRKPEAVAVEADAPLV